MARSFASRNQLAVSLDEVDSGSQLEWERHYLTTLGVANKRLYELRIQTTQAAYLNAEVRCPHHCLELEGWTVGCASPSISPHISLRSRALYRT